MSAKQREESGGTGLERISWPQAKDGGSHSSTPRSVSGLTYHRVTGSVVMVW